MCYFGRQKAFCVQQRRERETVRMSSVGQCTRACVDGRRWVLSSFSFSSSFGMWTLLLRRLASASEISKRLKRSQPSEPSAFYSCSLILTSAVHHSIILACCAINSQSATEVMLMMILMSLRIIGPMSWNIWRFLPRIKDCIELRHLNIRSIASGLTLLLQSDSNVGLLKSMQSSGRLQELTTGNRSLIWRLKSIGYTKK